MKPAAMVLGAALAVSCTTPKPPPPPPSEVVFEGVSWTTSRAGAVLTGRGTGARLSRETGAFSVTGVRVRFPRGLTMSADELHGQVPSRRTPFVFQASGGVRLELDAGIAVAGEQVEYSAEGVLHTDGPVSARVEAGGAVAEHHGGRLAWDAVAGRIELGEPRSSFHWSDGGESLVTADHVSFDDRSGVAVYSGHVMVAGVACATAAGGLFHNDGVRCR